MSAANLKIGTRVRIEALVGPTFEPDWSGTGKVVRHHSSWRGQAVPNGYHTIRYDSDGARLMVHRQRLMACNDQAA